jgi:hypothetical protein
MIKLIGVLGFLILAACGNQRTLVAPLGCSALKKDTSAFVNCQDGTKVELFNGKDGSNGVSGEQGVAGLNGSNGVNGTNGLKGEQGIAGAKGDKGDKGDTGYGQRGAPAIINQSIATKSLCPYGGMVIESFTDINGNGVYDNKDANHQVFTLCNQLVNQDSKENQDY